MLLRLTALAGILSDFALYWFIERALFLSLIVWTGLTACVVLLATLEIYWLIRRLRRDRSSDPSQSRGSSRAVAVTLVLLTGYASTFFVDYPITVGARGRYR